MNKSEKGFGHLRKAVEASEESARNGGFPVGAVIVKDNKIIAAGISNGKKLADPTSHAETAAIREACRLYNTRKIGGILYSSLEPCLMCYSASFWAGIEKIVFACRKEKVSRQHFEGNYKLERIEKTLRNPVKLVHVPKLENQALDIIRRWEKNQKNN